MKKLLIGFLVLFAATPAFAESSSFARLMALGQSVECTFSKPDGSQNGTIFAGQGKLRGEFNIKEGGSESLTHMINDGQKMYMWGGPMGETQGMIMSARPGAPSPMGGPQATDLNEEMDFSCKPWNVDGSQFVPPANVQFQDMAQMMADAMAAAQQQ